MNRILLEQTYVMQLGMYMERFQWIPTLRVAKFRCPICGDSQKSNYKTRGYVYINPQKRTHFNYKCHNCGYNNTLLYFLKEHVPSLYSPLKKEIMVEYLSHKSLYAVEKKEQQPKEIKNVISNVMLESLDLMTVDKLPDNHPAKIYCLNRLIPNEKLKRIIYTKNFKDFIEKIYPDKYQRMPADERIIFELRDLENNLVGVQGRVIEGKNKKNRFLTLKFDDSANKIYGLDNINKKLPVIVTEGIIDSLFMDNALALTGGDVISNLDEILGIPKSNIFIALDNEPRSEDTVHRMDMAIKNGYMVHFWTFDTAYKDINDMVLHGKISAEYIQNEILTKSLTGFKARVKFNSWKKV